MAITRNLLTDGDFSDSSPYPRATYNARPFQGSVRIDGTRGEKFGAWVAQADMLGLAYAKDPAIVNYPGLPYNANPYRQLLSLNYPVIDSTGHVIMEEGNAYTAFTTLRSGSIAVTMYYTRKPAGAGDHFTGSPYLLFAVQPTPGTPRQFNNAVGPFYAPTGRWAQVSTPFQIASGVIQLYLRVACNGVAQADDGVVISDLSVTYPHNVLGTLTAPAQSPVTARPGSAFPALTMHFQEDTTRFLISHSPIYFLLEDVSPANGIAFVNNQRQRIDGTTDASGNYTMPVGSIMGTIAGATATLVGFMDDGAVITVPLSVIQDTPPPVESGPYYVSVYNNPAESRCDLQDAVVGTNFNPLNATVLDRNQKPVASGQILFNDGSYDGTGGIMPTGEQERPVTSGRSTQTNVTAFANTGSQDYGTAHVKAYPTDLRGSNLAGVPANRYATYTLRVWTSMSAIVAATDGTPQTTKPNTEFARQLKAKVTESNGSSVVPDLLVSFMINGTRATFDLKTATVEPSSTATMATVRTDASGIATSPKVKAGPDEDTVVVLAKTVVASKPASYALTIEDQDTPPAGNYKYGLLPLSGNPAKVDLGTWNMLDWQVWDDDNDSVFTGSVNCTMTLNNTGGTLLSFDPTRLQTQTTVLAAGGTLEVPVYGGTVKNTGATITAQVEKAQSAPNTVNIEFK